MNLESGYYLVKPTLIWMKIIEYSFPKHVLYSYTKSAIFVQSTLKHFLNILQTYFHSISDLCIFTLTSTFYFEFECVMYALSYTGGK
jgi:hypothetical protein